MSYVTLFATMNILPLIDQNIPSHFGKLERALNENLKDRMDTIFSQGVRSRWTSEEELILKNAVERCKRENSSIFADSNYTTYYRFSMFFVVSQYPEVKQLGRNVRQLREKWIRDICPDSLGGIIQESHKKIIEELYKKNFKRWAQTSKEFAEMKLPDKPLGKYYSGNAIKNYFYSKNRVIQPEIDSSTTTSEAIEFSDEKAFGKRKRIQEKVERVVFSKIHGSWTAKDEKILKEVIEKHTKEHPDMRPYCGSGSDPQWSKVFLTISKYPEIKQLDRNAKQLREKWIRDICPNSLGGSIQKNHQKTIERLYQANPNKWTAISKEFAEMDLCDKPLGKFYSDNTIKNYFYVQNRRIQRNLALDLNLKSALDKEEGNSIVDADIDFPCDDFFNVEKDFFSDEIIGATGVVSSNF